MSCPRCRYDGEPRRVYAMMPRAIVRCPSCGLVRVHPMPTAAEAIAQYDDTYFADPEHGYVDYLADEPVHRAEFRRRLRQIRAAGGDGRLLDVGAATGGLIAEADAMGFEASGIEPAEGIARLARERTGRPVQAVSIERALLSRASYDVITLFEVLEHVTDPSRTLQRLRAALRPGGLLAITVPDLGSWWARVLGRRWQMITPHEHLVYFTRRTLLGMVREAGFVAPAFASARTPMSARTLATRLRVASLFPGGAWDCSLPFGTIFLRAYAPPL